MKKWTKEEIKILENNFSLSNEFLTELLPGRSRDAIESKKKSIEMEEIIPNKTYSYEDAKTICEAKNYDLLSPESDYHNTCSKLRYICNKHRDKGEQLISLSHLYQGRGCYHCGRDTTESCKRIKLDKEYHRAIVEEKGFKYIDTRRENGKIVIDFICPNHKEIGVQTMNKWYMENKAVGCKYCHGHTLPEWYVMMKMKEINPYIKLLEPYKNMSYRMKCMCTKHNYEIRKSMQEILNGEGCKYCGAEKLSEQHFMDDNEVQSRVSKKHSHIQLIKYCGIQSSDSEWLCTKHNKHFHKVLSTMLRTEESGCDQCYKERMRDICGLPFDEFKNRLQLVHPELNIIGKYQSANSPLTFYCTMHKHSFQSTPVNVLKRTSCCPKSFKTYKEESVCQLLEDWGYVVERQKTFIGCSDKNLLKFDCYLPDFNTVIEYDGENHFYPVKFGTQSFEDAKEKHEYTLQHDKIKNEYCKKNNISIVRVPYYEYDDLEYYLFDQLCKIGVIEEIQIA